MRISDWSSDVCSSDLLMSDNEMCGRLGGDEFAIVMREAGDTDRIEKLAVAIIETLSRPYEVDQNTLYIGASVGVAIGPRDGRTAEMLIRSADQIGRAHV